jgi:hypothetical protein
MAGLDRLAGFVVEALGVRRGGVREESVRCCWPDMGNCCMVAGLPPRAGSSRTLGPPQMLTVLHAQIHRHSI